MRQKRKDFRGRTGQDGFVMSPNDTNYPGRICTANWRIVPSGLELQQSRGKFLSWHDSQSAAAVCSVHGEFS
jgi:hypothetical protein